MICNVIRTNYCIMICNQPFSHLFDVGKGAITEPDDIRVFVVLIGCKKDLAHNVTERMMHALDIQYAMCLQSRLYAYTRAAVKDSMTMSSGKNFGPINPPKFAGTGNPDESISYRLQRKLSTKCRCAMPDTDCIGCNVQRTHQFDQILIECG